MLNLLLDIKRGTSLWTFRKRAELKVKLSARPGEPVPYLPQVAAAMFQLSPAFYQTVSGASNLEPGSVLVKNTRGRPPESFSLRSSSKLKKGEELFFAQGQLEVPPEDFENAPDEQEVIAFSFQVSSNFDSFANSKNILHSIQKDTRCSLGRAMPPLSPQKVLSLLPLRLQTVRMGFENFRSRIHGSMLGFAPGIEGRFYLEITPRSIELLASESALELGQVLPFEKEGYLEAFSNALKLASCYSGLLDVVRERMSLDKGGRILFET